MLSTTTPTEPARASRVQRVRHEIVRRELTVLRTERLSPHLLAVTVGGPQLAGFTSLSFDDHLKVMLPGADGAPVMRDYTPRRHDAQAQTLTVEFALHGGGQADEWASRLQPGDTFRIGGPRGSMVIPLDYDWHVLAGDLSAVPAMRRRLDELPAGARVQVIALWDDPADDVLLQPPAGLRAALQFTRDPQAFLAAMAALRLPAGEGYVWCAGDADTMRQAREVWLHQQRQPKEALRVAAYWKHGASDFHERLEG